MTFLPELKRLMDAATKGPWFIERDDRPNMEWNNHILEEKGGTTVCFMAHSGNEDNSRHENAAELIAYLVNHAPAIAELVEAAEKLKLALDAKIVMEGRNGVHKRLDEHLAWRQNDELAQRMAEEALALYSEALAKLNANAAAIRKLKVE